MNFFDNISVESNINTPKANVVLNLFQFCEVERVAYLDKSFFYCHK
jgi:hypothetical protein